MFMSIATELPPVNLDVVNEYAPHAGVEINQQTGNIGAISLLREQAVPDTPPNVTFVYDAAAPLPCFEDLKPKVAKTFTPNLMALIALSGIGLNMSEVCAAYDNRADELIDYGFSLLELQDNALERVGASYQLGLLHPWRKLQLPATEQTRYHYINCQQRIKHTEVKNYGEDNALKAFESLREAYSLPNNAAALVLSQVAQWQLQPESAADADTAGVIETVAETREAFTQRLATEGVGNTIASNGLTMEFNNDGSLTDIERKVLTLWLLDFTGKETLRILRNPELSNADISSILMSAQIKQLGVDTVNRSHAIGHGVEKDFVRVAADSTQVIDHPLHAAVARLAATGQSDHTITHYLRKAEAYRSITLDEVNEARRSLNRQFNASSISQLTMALYGSVLDKQHAAAAYCNDHKRLLTLPLRKHT